MGTALNLDWLNGLGLGATAPATTGNPSSTVDQKQSIWDKYAPKLLDVGINAAAQHYGVGGLNQVQTGTTTDANGKTVVYEQGQVQPVKASGFDAFLGSLGNTIQTAAAQAGQVLAAREVNKDLNKNPPITIYVTFVLVVGAAYLLLKK